MFNPNSGQYEKGWRPTEVVPQGMWEDVVNPKTGEHSLKTHTLKVVKDWCPEDQHEFDPVVPPSRRIVCKKCGVERIFIVGVHEFVGNSIRPKNLKK